MSITKIEAVNAEKKTVTQCTGVYINIPDESIPTLTFQYRQDVTINGDDPIRTSPSRTFPSDARTLSVAFEINGKTITGLDIFYYIRHFADNLDEVDTQLAAYDAAHIDTWKASQPQS